MPKSLDPNTRITFTLASDMELPEEVRPRLVGRVLTAGPYRVAMQALAFNGSQIEQLDGLLTTVMTVVKGWENMNDPVTGEPIPFSREALAQYYDPGELAEVVFAAFPNADDKKKSELLPLSDAANSASPAVTDAKPL